MLKFNPPITNASGVFSDSPYLLKIWEKAGVGVVISKSITLHEKKCNFFDYFSIPPKALIVHSKDSTINSMGLPNKGSDWWVSELEKYSFNVPLIISIATGTGDLKEYSLVQEKFLERADAFEINVSCPNTGKKIIAYNSDLLENVLSSLSYKKPIIVKLPGYYEYSSVQEMVFEPDEVGKYFLKEEVKVAVPAQIDETSLIKVLDILEDYNVKYVTSMNTIPVSHPILGPPVGGLSGRLIHNIAVRQAKMINDYSPNLKIFASGGVLNSMDANDFLEIPNVIAVQLASGLFQYDIPELFVKKILKHLIIK